LSLTIEKFTAKCHITILESLEILGAIKASVIISLNTGDTVRLITVEYTVGYSFTRVAIIFTEESNV